MSSFRETLRPSPEHQVQRERAYELYLRHTREFKPLFLDYLAEEHRALKKAFPNVSFFSRARIKSPRSYMGKVDKYLAKGETSIPIYDILAEKHIIEAVGDDYSENTCISACYSFLKFLEAFQKEHSFLEVPERLKDYIKSPKGNGYQSLHSSSFYSSLPDFHMETQIKTASMEELAKNGEASHSKNYKKRTIESQPYRSVPTYIVINDILNPPVMEMSFKECFQYYYGIPYEEYIQSKASTKESSLI